jgi:hypothetical protein
MRTFVINGAAALWSLAPVRLTYRLVSAGLNLVTVRELVTALCRADLHLTLIAIAWLIPWEKVAVLAYRFTRHRRTARLVTASAR